MILVSPSTSFPPSGKNCTSIKSLSIAMLLLKELNDLKSRFLILTESNCTSILALTAFLGSKYLRAYSFLLFFLISTESFLPSIFKKTFNFPLNLGLMILGNILAESSSCLFSFSEITTSLIGSCLELFCLVL